MSALTVLDVVAGIPRDSEGPVFGAPWQAQAFAMAVTLQERGVFTWAEWADVLGAARRSAEGSGEADSGESYYRDWLATLERMVTGKGLAALEVLARTRDAWDRAADRTPHGEPITLRTADFS